MYLRNTAINSIIALVFTFIAGFLGYAFRVLLAHKLTVADYGLFYAIFSFLGFFIVFIDLGLTQSLARTIIEFRVKKKFDAIKSVLLSSFFLQISLSIIIATIFLVLTLFTPVITNYFKTQNPVFFILMLIWFVTLPVDLIIQSFLNGFQRIRLLSAIIAIKATMIFCFTFILFYLGWDLMAPFLSYAICNISLLILLFPVLLSTFPNFLYIPYVWNYKILRKIIIYGAFLAFAGLAWSVVTYTDSMMILLFRDTTEVGLYQAALPLAAILTFFINALNTVVYPLFSRLNAEKNNEKIVQGASLLYKYIFVGMIPLAFVMFSFPEIIIDLLFGTKFIGAVNALRILAIGTIFFSLASFNITVLLATGNAKIIAKLAGMIAIFNIASNFIFVPYYGFTGAAFTTAMSFTLLLLGTLFVIKKYFMITLPVRNWILNFIVGLFMIALIWYVKNKLMMNLWLELFVIIFIAGIFYTALLFLLKIIRLKEVFSIIRNVMNG